MWPCKQIILFTRRLCIGGIAVEKKWSYAELSKHAKEAGGPEAYGKILQKHGFQRGVMVMLPVCISGCVVAYKKGTQIVGFVTDKLGIVTKKDVIYAKQQLAEMETMECPVCGRKAYGIDEINVIFGFIRNESRELELNNCCKQCVQK